MLRAHMIPTLAGISREFELGQQKRRFGGSAGGGMRSQARSTASPECGRGVQIAIYGAYALAATGFPILAKRRVEWMTVARKSFWLECRVGEALVRLGIFLRVWRSAGAHWVVLELPG
jgi:hypothetical protein